MLYNPRAVFWTMPLGLIAVGSALGRWEVRVVDGRLETDPERAVVEASRDAVCVGIGVLTGAPIRDALRMSRAVKAASPRVKVAWGGWHPSLFPESCLADPAIDATVAGQGERSFAALAERWAAHEEPDDIPGVTWRKAGAVVRNPGAGTIDVNELPAHDYGLVDVPAYYARKGRRQLDYISSIGCRFRCAFCADPQVYERAWYGLAPERISEELAAMHRRHPFDEVAFQDETFFTGRERVETISEALLGAGLRATWTATMRADQGHRLPDASLALARRAGLRRAMIGVEAGTDAMLKRIRKDIRIDQVWETAEKLKRHGVGAIWNFIVGFPDETPEELEAAIAVARKLRAMSPDFEVPVFFYRPYPGSPIADGLRDYPFPRTLEGWADFDYVGGAGEWVSPAQRERVERFKFYQRIGYGRNRSVLTAPLRRLARWRVESDWYRYPVEQRLIEWVRPGAKLS